MINWLDLKLSAPEITTLLSALVILMLSVFVKQEVKLHEKKTACYACVFSLLIIIVVLFANNYGVHQSIFGGQLIVDNLSTILKIAISLTTLGVLVYSRDYLLHHEIMQAEFAALVLFSILGMFILVSAQNMLIVYLGLEVFSISLYALVAMTKQNSAIEASIKYFLTGALASGVFLYGVSIVFGITGSFELSAIAKALAANATNNNYLILAFAYIFILVAIAFKLGVAPFHMWMPDVYQGTNNTIVGFIATASKLAVVGFAFRVIYEVIPGSYVKFTQFLSLLAVLSLLVGNVMAIAQTNFKRMLAYSSISHMGFVMLGLLLLNKSASAAVLFYIISYAVMNAAVFGIILMLSYKGFEADALNDYRGLNMRSPFLSLMMMLVMFTMAGIPPFSGFFAKFFILQELIAAGYMNLALFALIMSVIGGFYYLRVIWLMYFEKPDNFEPVEICKDNKIILSINGIFVILLGIFAQYGIYICRLAF